MAKLKIILSLTGILFLGSISAQIVSNELPPSFFEKTIKSSVPQFSMIKPNIETLKKEDLLDDQAKDIPWRFGVEQKVQINTLQSGTWTSINPAQKKWELLISAKEAISINLNFSEFYLPESAKLFISNADYSDFIGALTSSNNKSDLSFATRPVQGDLMLLELIIDNNELNDLKLEISGIVYGYRSVLNQARKTFGSSGNCNINIECNAGTYWKDVAKSVVLITRSNNTRLCTGTLLNNVQNNNKPYVLTAAHCGLQGSSIFIFNYNSPNCTPNTDGSLANSVSTAFSRALNASSDFHLFELSSNIPSTYGVTYAGWDMSNRVPSMTAGIHHPSGDVKKISIDYDSPSTSGYFSSGTTHWKVEDWDLGTTEGGSSGSALFDEFQRVIGQLEGGSAACGNDLEDYYGKASVSWNGGSGSSNRLRDWLDPLNTGTLVLNSKFSNIPANQRDFASIYIKEPSGLSCGIDSIDTYFLLKNYSSDTVRQLNIAYQFNSTVDTIRWNGISTYGEVIKINTPMLPLNNGSNRFDVINIGPSTANNVLNNDTIGFDVTAVTNPVDVYVTIKTDNYGSETSWEINSMSNTNYYSGGPYTDINGGRIYRDTVCLFDSCFNFVLKDAFGDGFNDLTGNFGNGYALLRDANGDTLLFENSFFTSSKTINFCPKLLTQLDENTKPLLSIYPNPVAKGGLLKVNSSREIARYRLFNIEGQLIQEGKPMGTNEIRIPNAERGIFLIELIEENGSIAKEKLLITD